MTGRKSTQFARQSRIYALLKDWTSTSVKKSMLHAKSVENGSPQGMKPSLLHKVTRWMEQIALLEHKEQNIISEISFIEKKHDALRKKKKLRRVKPELEDHSPRKKKDRFWFWFFILMLLFRNKQSTPKPQNG